MRIRFEPSGVTTQAAAGATLLDAARGAGVEIENVCGGRGTCGKCRVIATGALAPLTALETRGLSEAEVRAGYRLACQAVIQGDAEVVVPEESRLSRVSILADGVQRAMRLEPWATRHTLRIAAATLEDQVSDLENVQRHWPAGAQGSPGRSCPYEFSLGALRELPAALRAQRGEITLTAVDEQVVRISAGRGVARLLGIAFDIGTTTVVGYLMDLESGAQLAVSSLLNPQTRYGDDVVSRIDFATRDAQGLRTLQSEVVGALNKIISATAAAAGVPVSDILAMSVVGNTTMQHLLLGISPEALARAPYVPVVTQALRVRAEDLGLILDSEARVWVLPNIAGWVGADTVGVILSTGMAKQDEIALAIDIGTNGEMVLGSRERLITCSTAAGPAFEGAHLSCGMRAADGAIDVITMDGDVHWHAIGEGAPRGICGSGLVDMVAAMLYTGIIDETGMMQAPEALHADGYAALAQRLSQVGRQREFELVSAAEGAGGRAVKVTQRDVRELQLAKGAIRAGIQILLKELGIGPEGVQKVYLAGAFGNYIRPTSALAIGLIPHFPHAEIVPVGNAAGSGAKLALLSTTARAEATAILRHVEYLELSGRPDFQDEFAEAMAFA
jgi:uncharacterized 2Fe-2S/4Fe-4S cluster protein (DUF4445 family)